MNLAGEADMGSREWPFAILIVEDHALIASSIEDIVRTMGARAIGRAGKLSDALTLIETVSWDAALLDFRLTQGEMTYPAADQLRAKGVPFAFVTGWDGDVDPQYCDVPVLRSCCLSRFPVLLLICRKDTRSLDDAGYIAIGQETSESQIAFPEGPGGP